MAADSGATERRGIPSGLTSWIVGKGLSRDFWLFFVAALFFDFGFAMFLFLYNLFLLDIGYTERQLGLIVGAMTIGGVVGTLPMGWLAQRVGLRRVLLGGFIVSPLIAVLRTMCSRRAEPDRAGIRRRHLYLLLGRMFRADGGRAYDRE